MSRTLIVPCSTNDILNLWRCRCRWRHRCKSNSGAAFYHDYQIPLALRVFTRIQTGKWRFKELTWKSFLTASCAFAIATVCFHLAWMRNACAYIVSQYNTKAPSIDSLLLFLDFKTTPAVTAQMKRPRGSRLNDFYYSWACRQRLFCDRRGWYVITIETDPLSSFVCLNRV